MKILSMDLKSFNSVPPTAARVALPPILIADDDPDDLFLAMHLIKRTGNKHPVMTFDDGTGVVNYLSRAWLERTEEKGQLPRLLFLDLKMARLGGFAFLEWIAAHPELSGLYIVVLSGSDEPQDVERAKALGAKRYLAKHPGVATFARIIAHVYGHAAIAADTLPREPVPPRFFEESVNDHEPIRTRSRVVRPNG